MTTQRSKLLATALGACLLFNLAGAQSLAAPATAPAPTEKPKEEAPATPAPGLPVQDTVPAAADDIDTAPSGPKVTTQQFGDWLLECYDPAINNVNCQIKQRIVQKDTDQNILVMSMAFDPKEKTNVIQYVLPLDFLLTPGVSVEIDNYQSTVGVNRCAAQGCFVEGTTDEAFTKALRAAKTGGRVVIVSRTGQKVGINFSGAGFSRAYDEMVKENTRLAASTAPKN